MGYDGNERMDDLRANSNRRIDPTMNSILEGLPVNRSVGPPSPNSRSITVLGEGGHYAKTSNTQHYYPFTTQYGPQKCSIVLAHPNSRVPATGTTTLAKHLTSKQCVNASTSRSQGLRRQLTRITRDLLQSSTSYRWILKHIKAPH